MIERDIANSSTTTHTYISAKERLSENMSTAYSLLSIGVFGLIIAGLSIFKIINFISGLQIIILIVLSVLMLSYSTYLFINKKKMIQAVLNEDKKNLDYLSFLRNNLDLDKLKSVSSGCSLKEEAELIEINYISKMLVGEFPMIDENLADKLSEEFWNELHS